MKHKLKFAKWSSRLARTRRRFCVDIRLVLMFLLMFHYAEPMSRQGCYIHMDTITVNSYSNRVNILKPAGKTIPVGDNVLKEENSSKDACKTRCDNDKATCYLLVLDIASTNQTCYLGNKEAIFHLDPEKSSTHHGSDSYINLCDHPVKQGEDCYHTTTTTWVPNVVTDRILDIPSASVCGLNCNNESLCYGYYYDIPAKRCYLYKDDETYSITLSTTNYDEHEFGFKKCFACADEPCMNRGTCAHVSGTCCDYDCTCQGGTIGTHCENCNKGYGLEGQVCKPCRIGSFNPGGGKTCKNCTVEGVGLTNNSTASTTCDVCDVSFGKNGTKNGHITCKKCDGNTYSATKDDSECKDCGSLMIPTNCHAKCVCKPGYEQGNLDCEPCNIGSFNPSKDLKCEKCTGEGLTTNSTGSENCDACDVGYGKNGTINGHITCKKCDGDTYSDSRDGSECKSCGDGMKPTDNHSDCVAISSITTTKTTTIKSILMQAVLTLALLNLQ